MNVAEKFALAIENKFNAESGESAPKWEITVESGRKFDKIILDYSKEYSRHRSRSVHAFVERSTGDLIKAAGWNAPAKIKTGWATKYNLITDFDLAVEKADFAGGYLYQ